MKIYIAGKITGLENYKETFQKAHDWLTSEGHIVMNPSIMPPGFEHHEYMKICYSMIDACEGVYFLKNWTESVGAKLEHEYAVKNNKKLVFEF